MNQTQINWLYDATHAHGSPIATAILEELKADARALWAVRVAMAVGRLQCDEHDKCPTPEVMHPGGPGWAVCWHWPGAEHGVIHKQGHTPEEAMLHFAEAVYPDLPESERARLGVRP